MDSKDEKEKNEAQPDTQTVDGGADAGGDAQPDSSLQEKSVPEAGSEGENGADAAREPEAASSAEEKDVPGDSPERQNAGDTSPAAEPVEVSEPQEDRAAVSQKAAATQAGENNKQRGGFLKLLLIIVLLGAIGLAGFWLYLQQGESSELVMVLDQQQRSITALQQQLSDEKEQRQRQKLEQQELLTDLHGRINSHSKRLRELSTTTRDDWLLAEAEYLMRLANQRLLTERNTKNATSLLETADQILRDLDDVDLFPVRKTLASDITALRMASDIDREGLYLRLNALAESLTALPLLSANPAGERDVVEIDSDAGDASGWRDTLQASFNNLWQHLSTLVRVQRREGGVEPLLSADEEQYIRHNLRFMLEQAQLALLREEPEVYRHSLVKARDWTLQYFSLNDQSAVLVAQLEAASSEPVIQVLPDISGSLEELRVFIDSWHKRYSVSGDKAGEQAEMAQ